jgi:hypothetical protein
VTVVDWTGEVTGEEATVVDWTGEVTGEDVSVVDWTGTEGTVVDCTGGEGTTGCIVCGPFLRAGVGWEDCGLSPVLGPYYFRRLKC